MRIRLLNGMELKISEAPKFEGAYLKIMFNGFRCEEAAETFADKVNIATIKVIDDNDAMVSVLNGYTEEVSVELIEGITIVNLQKASDNISAEITELKKADTLMQKQIDNTVAAVDFVLTEEI